MDRFGLEEDESLERRCGEIFLTTKGRILFHCALCEEAFCGFESYDAHLNVVHLTKNFNLEIEPIDLARETFELTQTLKNYLDAELKDFDKELKEMLNATATNTDSCDESSSIEQLSHSLKDRNKNRKKSNSLSADNKSFSSPKNVVQSIPKKLTPKAQDLKIPEEIRMVIKRVVYKPQTISEEDRKHKCPICDLGFKDKGNMIHHFKRHSNEKNYVCHECHKKFHSSTELNNHITSHTSERTFLCPECGRMFATKSSLGNHLKLHRNIKDYHCQYSGCQKAFSGGQLLKNHMLTHTKERRFPCSLCDAAFKRVTALRNHIKLHENKREYECRICLARFNQKAGLFWHLKSHKSV